MKKESIFKIIAAGFFSALMLFSTSDATGEAEYEYLSPNAIKLNTASVGDDDYDVVSEDEYKTLINRNKKLSAIQAARNSLLLVISFVLSVSAKFILDMACEIFKKSLGVSSNAIISFIADIIVNFVIIAILFAISYKIFYPQRKLKELFTIKNTLYMLALSAIIKFVEYALGLVLKKAYIINQILQCVFNIASIGFVWIKIFNLKGVFAPALKKALHSAYGKRFLILFICANIFAVVLKIISRNAKIISGYIQLSFVFIIASFMIICGYGILKPRKNILILK